MCLPQAKACFLFLLFFFVVLTPAFSAGRAESRQIWYVNASNQGVQDGLGWKTAFSSLQSALHKAESGDEIWVARGTYYPDESDRSISFDLKENVSVYGGFSGSETRLDQRSHQENPTILSGNIGGGDQGKNTITIVKGADKAVLDGFTISDAYSTDTARMHLVPADILKNDMSAGGGMRNYMVGPTVRNCVFKNNYSPKGGAVYNVQAPQLAQAEFVDVAFIDNTAQVRGGAVSNDLGAMPKFINCKFINNRSEDKGGALYNDFAASPLVVNSIFESNSAVTAGAIGNDGGSSPLLVNVTISNNKADSGLGDGLYQGTGANNNPILINSSVDNIYNWHEDTVATLNSTAPESRTVPLGVFISISNLNGNLDTRDLEKLPDTRTGYQADLDGNRILSNHLVGKLIGFYAKSGGAINYADETQRPEVTRKPAKQAIIHVVPGPNSGTQDGGSWSNGVSDLQAAIEMASVSNAPIWIKAGTYSPQTKDSRIAAFILYDNVKLYGGFGGFEKSLGERDVLKNPTILSGLAKQDNYRYPHVLYGADKVVLDGLTISEGNASGFTYNGKGGGLIAYRAGKTFLPHDEAIGFTMEIHNCRFTHNSALEGGAIYAFGKAKLTITNTAFEDNQAVYGGAVMDREGNQINYTGCRFQDNHSTEDGGAVYVDYGSHAGFEGVEFKNNSAKSNGGAIYVISRASQLEASHVDIGNSIFQSNTALKGSNLFNLDQSEVIINDSTLEKLEKDSLHGIWKSAARAEAPQS
jgi:predicted outer membrane repeat protein